MMLAPAAHAYTNISPEQVRARLAAGDTLQLLDVREVNEYEAGHIAEPAGQLPITPANIPWNSGVLESQFNRLSRDIDILVYCSLGGRGAQASAFLETRGFTRISNMTGGFNAWNFEKRDKGFGDHSGLWIEVSDTQQHVVQAPEIGEQSFISLSGPAIPGSEKIYLELHFASWSTGPFPPDVPQSDMQGLYRVTALDKYGVPLFKDDSLSLGDPADLQLLPLIPTASINTALNLSNERMTVFVPDEGWLEVSFTLDELLFSREENVLRRWYNLEGYGYSSVTSAPVVPETFKFQIYPNPFNGAANVLAPAGNSIKVYDIRGRFIHELTSSSWTPDASISSGTYLFVLRVNEQRIAKRAVYLK
jgi:rhodanese-related sulfurtransferase